ncbi:hypothetical protein ACFOSD_13070 [Salinispirillum marinum]|uniref:Uncharacterized protein n=2 Tax=Saccharospirillaceae TaxID=255527 RepID=A0ABV8BIU2_9GAMM
MSGFNTASIDWLWNESKQQPHVRHWPAVQRGMVHIHDVTSLGELKKQADTFTTANAWVDFYHKTMTPERLSVAVDTLADMIDHDRGNCLGEHTIMKGHSSVLFALARGEVVTKATMSARLAVLATGLAVPENAPISTVERTQQLSEFTVSDLQLLAAQVDGIRKNQKKADLVKDILAAEEIGGLDLPLGDLVPAPKATEWLEQLVNQYVRALHDALADPVYPTQFREAVLRQAKSQVTVNALKRALEVEYWDVLEQGIEDTPEDPSIAPESISMRDWTPPVGQSTNDTPWIWAAIALVFIFWIIL